MNRAKDALVRTSPGSGMSNGTDPGTKQLAPLRGSLPGRPPLPGIHTGVDKSQQKLHAVSSSGSWPPSPPSESPPKAISNKDLSKSVGSSPRYAVPAEMFLLAEQHPQWAALVQEYSKMVQRLELEKGNVLAHAQEMQRLEESREQELMQLENDNQSLLAELQALRSKVTQGLGRDGLVESLQAELKKALAERDEEAKDADALYEELQLAKKAATSDMRRLKAGVDEMAAALGNGWRELESARGDVSALRDDMAGSVTCLRQELAELQDLARRVGMKGAGRGQRAGDEMQVPEVVDIQAQLAASRAVAEQLGQQVRSLEEELAASRNPLQTSREGLPADTQETPHSRRCSSGAPNVNGVADVALGKQLAASLAEAQQARLELAEAAAQLELARSELKASRAAAARACAELESVTGQLAHSSEQLIASLAECDRLGEEVAQLRVGAREREVELQAAQDKAEAVGVELQQAREEASRQRDDLAAVRAELADVQARGIALHRQLAELVEKVAGRDAELAAAQAASTASAADAAASAARLAEVTQQLAAAQAELAAASEKLVKMGGSSDACLSDVEVGSVAALRAELESHHADQAARRAELADASIRMEQLNAELAVARRDVARLAGELAESRDELAARDAELASARAQASMSERAMTARHVEQASSKVRESMSEQLGLARHEAESIRAELELASAQLELAKAELEPVKADRESAKAELELERIKAASMDAELASLRAELASARATLQRGEGRGDAGADGGSGDEAGAIRHVLLEVKALKEALAVAEASAERAGAEAAASSAALGRYRCHLAEAQAELADQQAEAVSLRGRLHALQEGAGRDAAGTASMAAQLQAARDELLHRDSAHRAQLDKARSELLHVRGQVLAMQDAMAAAGGGAVTGAPVAGGSARQAAALASQLRTTQSALAAARRDAAAGQRGAEEAEQRCAELARELASAHDELADAHAELAAARNELERDRCAGGGVGGGSEQQQRRLRSELMALREQLSGLQQLSMRHTGAGGGGGDVGGRGVGGVAEVVAEVAALRRQLDEQQRSGGADVARWRAYLAEAQHEIERLEAGRAALSRAEAHAAALERELRDRDDVISQLMAQLSSRSAAPVAPRPGVLEPWHPARMQHHHHHRFDQQPSRPLSAPAQIPDPGPGWLRTASGGHTQFASMLQTVVPGTPPCYLGADAPPRPSSGPDRAIVSQPLTFVAPPQTWPASWPAGAQPGGSASGMVNGALPSGSVVPRHRQLPPHAAGVAQELAGPRGSDSMASQYLPQYWQQLEWRMAGMQEELQSLRQNQAGQAGCCAEMPFAWPPWPGSSDAAAAVLAAPGKRPSSSFDVAYSAPIGSSASSAAVASRLKHELQVASLQADVERLQQRNIRLAAQLVGPGSPPVGPVGPATPVPPAAAGEGGAGQWSAGRAQVEAGSASGRGNAIHGRAEAGSPARLSSRSQVGGEGAIGALLDAAAPSVACLAVGPVSRVAWDTWRVGGVATSPGFPASASSTPTGAYAGASGTASSAQPSGSSTPLSAELLLLSPKMRQYAPPALRQMLMRLSAATPPT